MSDLEALVAARLDTQVPAVIGAVARDLQRTMGGDALLFYGSALRDPDLDGVLDFYVLDDEASVKARGWRPFAFLWPDVSYHELEIGGLRLRAKVARMKLATFERAAAGRAMDTTVWARFAQPARLVFARDEGVARRVRGAAVDCVLTAGRFAALLGPAAGTARDYWAALFGATYGTEFRIETRKRADKILATDPDYYDTALPAAWRRTGLLAASGRGALRPDMAPAERRRLAMRWRVRRWAGKPLNIMRLVKAAWTFEGAARYALWKIERHSGVHIPLTPWRERHPVLAAPGVLFRLWRAERR